MFWKKCLLITWRFLNDIVVKKKPITLLSGFFKSTFLKPAKEKVLVIIGSALSFSGLFLISTSNCNVPALSSYPAAIILSIYSSLKLSLYLNKASLVPGPNGIVSLLKYFPFAFSNDS
nr:hypothetical protein [Mycoplasmopsis bovis]